MKKYYFNYCKYFSLLLSCFFSTSFAANAPPPQTAQQKPELSQSFLYAGLIGGYANVDWDPVISQDQATYPTNPTEANGKGGLYGVNLGYQFNSYFAIEAECIKMPDTYLQFKPIALATYGVTSTSSSMQFSALFLKLMAPISDTKLSLSTEVGVAYQLRSDDIATTDTFAPTFGAGASYRINEHWMANFLFQYATGYGESIALPLTSYIPEIYAGTFSIDYIF